MFAINHAATALLLKRRYPSVSMLPLLISANIHLAHIPLVTHDHDVVLWPGASWRGLGLGLYGSAPMLAFAFAQIVVTLLLVGVCAAEPGHHLVARRA
jgi:hypothetical protein